MRAESRAWVYILTNATNVLLEVGMTTDLRRCIAEHKGRAIPGVFEKFNADKLVICEEFARQEDAVLRERQLKHWSRAKRRTLVARENPRWEDLSTSWWERSG